jgi:hypothetical protein
MEQPLKADSRPEAQADDLVPVPGNRDKMPKGMKTHGANDSIFEGQKQLKNG